MKLDSLSDGVKIALISAILNGGITWGVMATKLDWMRSDLAKLEQRIDRVEIARIQKQP
jgi:hypothetical protein